MELTEENRIQVKSYIKKQLEQSKTLCWMFWEIQNLETTFIGETNGPEIKMLVQDNKAKHEMIDTVENLLSCFIDLLKLPGLRPDLKPEIFSILGEFKIKLIDARHGKFELTTRGEEFTKRVKLRNSVRSNSPVQFKILEYTSPEKALELFPRQLFEAFYFRPNYDILKAGNEFSEAWEETDKFKAETFRCFLQDLNKVGFYPRHTTIMYFEYSGFDWDEESNTLHEVSIIIDFGDEDIDANRTARNFEVLFQEWQSRLQSEIFGNPECNTDISFAGVMDCRIIINEVF